MIRSVLIITNRSSTAKPSTESDSLKEFIASVQDLTSVRLTFCDVQDLLFRIEHGTCKIVFQGKELAQSYDVCLLRNVDKFIDYANAIRLYCETNKIRLISAGDATFPFLGKLSQGFLFALEQIPTPDLVSSPSNATLLAYLQQYPIAYPFIVKHNDGIKGLHNYLVHDAQQLQEVLSGQKQEFVAQPFIRNKGELRILTFGYDQEMLIFKKCAAPGTHLNNTARGSMVQKLKASDVLPEILKAAIQAAIHTGREIAGVDVLLADDDTWYILEVNHTAALSSGVLLQDKQVLFARFIAGIGEVQEKP